jgi:hypothetical protein
MEIIIPKGATTNIENGLVKLTEAICNKTGESGGFGLGGEFGYGVEYENDTFMLHPFCWCDKEDCKWCYKNEPNFIYKPTNTKIWWYKYIGRSQEQEGELPKDWLKECIKSL